jgi:hypothetical protein
MKFVFFIDYFKYIKEPAPATTELFIEILFNLIYGSELISY